MGLARKLRVAFSGLILGVGAAGAAQVPAAPPMLGKEQALQLFAAAGFRLADGRPVNRCGGASNPRIAFIDLNGDGRAEAHVADVDPKCYGRPGAYFAILAQEPGGQWKRLIAEDGIVGFDRGRTNGWNNLVLTARDSACPGTRRFTGADYGAADACSPFAATKTAATAPRGGTGTAISRQHLFDWEEDQTPAAKALSIADRNALFRAAGMAPVGGGKWTRCTDDTSGRSEAHVGMVEDINGDGRPEALIRDGGSFCNGFAGVNSTVLTRTPNGAWKSMFSSQGFVNFLVSRGVDDYPDIEVDLPGFCYPYWRWNGTEYDLAARLDDKGRPCRPN